MNKKELEQMFETPKDTEEYKIASHNLKSAAKFFSAIIDVAQKEAIEKVLVGLNIAQCGLDTANDINVPISDIYKKIGIENLKLNKLDKDKTRPYYQEAFEKSINKIHEATKIIEDSIVSNDSLIKLFANKVFAPIEAENSRVKTIYVNAFTLARMRTEMSSEFEIATAPYLIHEGIMGYLYGTAIRLWTDFYKYSSSCKSGAAIGTVKVIQGIEFDNEKFIELYE